MLEIVVVLLLLLLLLQEVLQLFYSQSLHVVQQYFWSIFLQQHLIIAILFLDRFSLTQNDIFTTTYYTTVT